MVKSHNIPQSKYEINQPHTVNRTLVGKPVLSKPEQNIADSAAIEFKKKQKPLIITKTNLSIMSLEDMQKLSICEIVNSDLSGDGSLGDPRLGTVDSNHNCSTCHENYINCPGHPGIIYLPKHFPNPIVSKELIYCLQCVCHWCGTLLMSEEDIKNSYLNNLKDSERLKMIAKESLTKSVCRRPGCKHTNVTLYPSKMKGEYKIPYTSGGISDEMEIEKVESILNSISIKDQKLLGFENPDKQGGTNPINFILKAILIIPPQARPYVYQEGEMTADYITGCYQDFIKAIKNYNEDPNTDGGVKRGTILKGFYHKICHFIDNTDKKYTKGKDQPILSIKERLIRKEGYIRSYVMGKRNDYCMRTVSGPGSKIPFGYAAIPNYMRKTLTVPEKVTIFNYQRLNDDFKSGRVPHVTFNSGAKNKGLRRDINLTLIKEHNINIGDSLERWMKTGDYLGVNRQPTLHKSSLLCHKVMFHDDLNFKTHSSITTALNLDHDGDEVNGYIVQTQQAAAEAGGVCSAASCIMSTQANRNMMGLVFNCPISAWVMSNYKEKIDDVYWEEAMEYMTKFTDRSRLLTLNERLKKNGIPENSGKALLSTLFPENFYYTGKDGVLIVDGILVKGRLSKSHIGPSDGSIIQVLNKMHTREEVVRFFTEGQFLFDWFVKWKGISIGYSDCVIDYGDFNLKVVKKNIADKLNIPLSILESIPDKNLNLNNEDDINYISNYIYISPDLNNNDLTFETIMETVNAVLKTDYVDIAIKKSMDRAKLQIDVLEDLPKNASEYDVNNREKSILTILRNASNSARNYGFEYMSEDNPNCLLFQSGSKGSKDNVFQITVFLGQQELDGKRLPLTMNKGKRANSYFPVGCNSLESRGFIKQNFMQGVDPAGMFAHMQGGREGLVDTANKTAKVGYLHHKIGKALEDIYIGYNGVVTDKKVIYQFALLDGFDPSQLIKTYSTATGEIMHFIDFKNVIGKLNNKYKN